MQLAEGRPLAEQLGINPDRPDSFAFVANGASCEVYCLSNVESCASEVSVGSQTVHLVYWFWMWGISPSATVCSRWLH
jgi:hypothetical protein